MKVKAKAYEFTMLIDFKDTSVFVSWRLIPEQVFMIIPIPEKSELLRVVNLTGVDITDELEYEDKVILLEDCYGKAAATKPTKRYRHFVEIAS